MRLPKSIEASVDDGDQFDGMRRRGVSKSIEFKLLRPRLVPLSTHQEGEAVALLAELLLDVARKRSAGAFSGVLDGASDRASGSAVSFTEKAGKASKAA